MKKAFTLLEMLIVLGIIAIILSVLTVSFSTTQKKSRDAKRKGDIKAIQNGLEQYYATCGYTYPTGISNGIYCGSSPAIITAMPVDPRDASSYSYTSDSEGSFFTLCTNSIETDSITGYCVNNQQ